MSCGGGGERDADGGGTSVGRQTRAHTPAPWIGVGSTTSGRAAADAGTSVVEKGERRGGSGRAREGAAAAAALLSPPPLFSPLCLRRWTPITRQREPAALQKASKSERKLQ